MYLTYKTMKFTNTIGFNHTDIIKTSSPLQIGLIDADLIARGTRHPNLALLKISGYCKEYGHTVELVTSYDQLEASTYDMLVMSKVFNFSTYPTFIQNMIDKGKIIYGGTGFFEADSPDLPTEVEHHFPDYTLYNKYIATICGTDKKLLKKYSDYTDYSIGYTTRGCFRKCPFCVNRKYSKVFKHSPVPEFLDQTRKAIYLWDDNIMGSADFDSIIDELIATGKRFQFRQGLDIRLMTDKKAAKLSKVKYAGDFIFAFDHIEDSELICKKLALWRRYCSKTTKLYVLTAYDSQDEVDIANTFERIKILMGFDCLPFVMMYEDFSKSRWKDLYRAIARWCNQPQLFKKKSFREFCQLCESYRANVKKPKKQYSSTYQAMLDFEAAYPDIAAKYYDIKLEEIEKSYK